MNVKTQSKQTPKFTSMEEMKRWQGEREDRLHREHVREKMQRHITEVCDNEIREQNREWMKRTQRERQVEPCV